MSDSSNFLRWGIPGWTLAVGFLVFVLSDAFLSDEQVLMGLIETSLKSSDFWQVALAGLLVAAAGVPLGFIIYQVYFYLRWNSPVSRDGLLPPLIVGRGAELHKTVRDLDVEMLTLGEPWRRELLPNLTNHRSSWHYLARLIMDAMLEAGESVYKRHSYLMSMLHSLGASYLGLTIGFMLYVAFKWRATEIEFIWIALVLVFIGFVLGFLYLEEHREESGIGYSRFSVRHPAELLLWAGVFLFLTLDPALSDLISYAAALGLVMALTIGWSIADKEDRLVLLLSTVILAIVSVIARRHLTANNLLVDWPLVFAMLLFGALTLAFLKNRQNVRDQLVAMEYYYLKPFLERPEDPQPELPRRPNFLSRLFGLRG